MFFSSIYPAVNTIWSRALSRSLSAPIVRTTEAIGEGAAKPIRTREPPIIARIFFGKLHQRGLLGLKGAVVRSSCTHKVRATVPIGFRAAARRAQGLIWCTATCHAATGTGCLVRPTLTALDLLALYLETGSHCDNGKEYYNDSHLSMCNVFQNWGPISAVGQFRKKKTTEITQSSLETSKLSYMYCVCSQLLIMLL